MAYAPYINRDRGSRSAIRGSFQHKETGKVFEFSFREQGEHGDLAPDYLHVIFVGPLGQETRLAKIKKTVVYVIVDELEDETPVIEKWFTKELREYEL